MSKTGVSLLLRDEVGRCLFMARSASGIQAARIWSGPKCGTWEPVGAMLRETRKRRTRERLSTNALHGGGSARSSDEGSVIELERRGRPGRWKERGNRKAGGPRSRNKGLATGWIGSRVGREEPYEARVSRTVLWGPGWDSPGLPDPSDFFLVSRNATHQFTSPCVTLPNSTNRLPKLH